MHVNDLVRLESAVNNHGNRDTLLRNIRGANLTDFIVDAKNHNTVPWLASHNILPLCVTFEMPLDQICEELIGVFFSQATKFHFKYRDECVKMSDIIAASFKSVQTICIKDSVVHSLGNLAVCRNLSALHLIGCAEIDEHKLRKCLRECNLHELAVHDPSPLSYQFFTDIFSLLPSLRSLELKLHRDWDPILNDLTGQTNLKQFDCECGTIGSATIHAIARSMPLLEVLILAANIDLPEQPQLLESDIELLVQSCPRIIELALMEMPAVKDAAAASIARHLPALESLTLMLCSLSDAGLSAITSQCTQLRSIRLPLDFVITNAGIHALGQQCAHLEHLSVLFDRNLTDRAFDTLNTATLRSINLSNVNLTGEFVKSLLREGSVLTKLICDGNRSNFSDFVSLLPQNNRLEDLSLTGATLTQAEWMKLSSRLTCLRRLNLSRCRTVDGDVVRSFFDHNPRLLSFIVYACKGVPRELFHEFGSLQDAKELDTTGQYLK